ncbi:hypothetical protein ACFL2Q_10175, partial [Thermodesulfobacteriota bacterium]
MWRFWLLGCHRPILASYLLASDEEEQLASFRGSTFRLRCGLLAMGVLMKDVGAEDAWRTVAPISEIIALCCRGNVKNLIVTALECKGPLDEEAWRLAVQKTVAVFPQLRSTVSVARKPLRQELVWIPRPDLEFPFLVSQLKRETHSASPDQGIEP